MRCHPTNIIQNRERRGIKQIEIRREEKSQTGPYRKYHEMLGLGFA